ncbi:post-GPI attachment to proteins factor 2-like [Gigantopelta aegis]|uniref:post-GPI attachment to proteins factor 2-like n=1 Tax=Gigantopelta aegis TaxID=1735272 RepID=UPI001B88AC68|nr:post-GPI attachment to proteins factor 2-like [Gigantopelta aegis]
MGYSTEKSINGVLLNVSMLKYAIITVSLPAVSLFVCFVTAFLWRFDDVNDTQCNVTNFIPSISAVTGITPQTYLWRVGVALHSTPRFIVAIMYYNYYASRIDNISKKYQNLYSKVMRLNFWLNIIENSSLVGVTYITNRENYPVHEKIFIVFMVASLCYMLVNTILFRWSRSSNVLKGDELYSYTWKKIMFVSICSATIGLLYFFYLHRRFCEPGAFSWFSFCEYVIAYTNMGYHLTAYYEFQDHTIMCASAASSQTNGTLLQNTDKKKK